MNIHKKTYRLIWPFERLNDSILSECPLHWEIKAYWHKFDSIAGLQLPQPHPQQHDTTTPTRPAAACYNIYIGCYACVHYRVLWPSACLLISCGCTLHSTDEGAPDVPVTHESTYSAHIPRVATRQERGGPYNPVRGETNLLQIAQVVICLYFTPINILF